MIEVLYVQYENLRLLWPMLSAPESLFVCCELCFLSRFLCFVYSDLSKLYLLRIMICDTCLTIVLFIFFTSITCSLQRCISMKCYVNKYCLKLKLTVPPDGDLAEDPSTEWINPRWLPNSFMEMKFLHVPGQRCEWKWHFGWMCHVSDNLKI